MKELSQDQLDVAAFFMKVDWTGEELKETKNIWDSLTIIERCEVDAYITELQKLQRDP